MTKYYLFNSDDSRAKFRAQPIEGDDIVRKVAECIWAPPVDFNELSSEQMDELQKIVETLRESGAYAMEDGWLQLSTPEQAVEWLLSKCEDLAEDRDHEDRERAAMVKYAQSLERQLQTIRDAFNIIRGG